MSTRNIMNTSFYFRTKFKKLLNDKNRLAIENAFLKFCNLCSKDAIQTLWRLTYSRSKALIELSKLGLDSELIPFEKILIFRNELRYQYEEVVQCDFLRYFEKDDERIYEAFLSLENRTDRIVASIVCAFCIEMLNDPNFDIERTLGLLSQTKENYYFGGVRSMNFNMEEAEYLKNYHLEIHNTLKTLKTVLCEEVEIPLNSSEKEMSSGFKELTLDTILEHKDVFKTFIESEDFNLLIPISQLGFDLNEVIIQREEIKNLLKAIKVFEK